jgi:hypothetical protein
MQLRSSGRGKVVSEARQTIEWEPDHRRHETPSSLFFLFFSVSSPWLPGCLSQDKASQLFYSEVKKGSGGTWPHIE